MDIKDKNLYYIGGVVRDEILGAKSFDIDLTYDGDAIKFAQSINGAKIIQINESFGTVRIEFKGEIIDIASTRSEFYPKKGHLPVVNKIGCDLKEDIYRRDFTINSMAKSTYNGEIIDFTGGLEDIMNKKIRVLHDKSFIDDPTRIIRALKFSIRFGFELDEHTKFLQNQYLSNINYDISYKRMQKELKETFYLNRWEAFERFINDGIYKLISPKEFVMPNYDFSKLVEKFKPKNIWIIYIGLLDDISNLPLTKIEYKIIHDYQMLKTIDFSQETDDFTIYKSFSKVPIESVIMYATINSEIAERYLNKLKDIKLLINGSDLQNLGISPSPEYKMCFDYVLKQKITNATLTKDDEIAFAKKYFNLLG